MLNEIELNELMDRLGVTEDGKRMVLEIRKAPPARLVKGGRGNVICDYPSIKMGVTIQAESRSVELPAIVLWEHDPDTYEFYDQPPRISVSQPTSSGKAFGYNITPDFFVIQKDYIGWIECKTESDLLAKLRNNSTAYVQRENGEWWSPPREEFASGFGLGFRVVSSADIPQIFYRNILFLSDYLHKSTPPVCADDAENIYQAFKGAHWARLDDLISELDAIQSGHVYQMIAERTLWFDLHTCVLAVPMDARVFRDELHARAYGCFETESVAEEKIVMTFDLVDLTPGAFLDWAGKKYTVVGMENDLLRLRDEKNNLAVLQDHQIKELLNRGQLLGSSRTVSGSSDYFDERMRHASPEQLTRALKLNELLRLSEKNRGQSIPGQLTPRTLRGWRRKEEESIRVCGSGIPGLFDRISERGNRERKVDAAVIDLMQKVIEQHFLVEENPKTRIGCYGILRRQCKDAGLLAPSSKTFYREIANRRASYEVTEIREGKKAAYKSTEFVYWGLDISTPVHGDRVFEIAHVDHTQMDVQLIDSDVGNNLGKAWLSVMLDAFSRMILAWIISFDPPSYRSDMLLVAECIRRHGRLPSVIVTDSGSDFKSSNWKLLMATFEIEHRQRPPKMPRFGSVIERFFGVANQLFFHQLQGENTGLQNPRSLSSSHDPRNLAIWTLPKLAAAFDNFIDNTHANLIVKAFNATPKQMYENSLKKSGFRIARLLPYSQANLLLCLPIVDPKGTKITAGRGIWANKGWYFHPTFRDPALHGSRVQVRYDPFNFGVVYAYLKGEWLSCESQYGKHLGNVTERKMRLYSIELRAKHLLHGTHEKRNSELVGANLEDLVKREAFMKLEKFDEERRKAQEALHGESQPEPHQQDDNVLDGCVTEVPDTEKFKTPSLDNFKIDTRYQGKFQ